MKLNSVTHACVGFTSTHPPSPHHPPPHTHTQTFTELQAFLPDTQQKEASKHSPGMLPCAAYSRSGGTAAASTIRQTRGCLFVYFFLLTFLFEVLTDLLKQNHSRLRSRKRGKFPGTSTFVFNVLFYFCLALFLLCWRVPFSKLNCFGMNEQVSM